MRLLFLFIFFLMMACKEKQSSSPNIEILSNQSTDHWEILKTNLINNETFNWQNFILIEGQNPEEYIHLFKNDYAIKALKKSAYSDLKDFDFYGTSVKVFSYEMPEENEKHTFYILEKNNEFKITGYLMTNL